MPSQGYFLRSTSRAPTQGVDGKAERAAPKPLGKHTPLDKPQSTKSRTETARQKLKRRRALNVLRLSVTTPLSQLQDLTHIPPPDIETHVKRGAEARTAELFLTKKAKVPGRIPRPLNSYCLYLKCYHARARAFCHKEEENGIRQPNGAVMVVCGASWLLEPAEVRERFDKWSEIEHGEHEEAFPDYEFPSTKPRQRQQPQQPQRAAENVVEGGDDEAGGLGQAEFFLGLDN